MSQTEDRSGHPSGAGQDIDWRAATLGVVVIAITIVPVFLTGALGVRIGDELGMDLGGIGALYAVLFGTSALTSSVTGRIAERIGWAAAVRVSAGWAAVTLGLLSLLPDNWWQAWWPVAILFALGGAAAALSQGGSNLALASAVPPSRYGLVFGLKHISVPVAAMLSGLAVPTVALTIGWRWAYVLAAGLAAATAAAVPRHSPTAPRARRVKPAGRPATPTFALAALAVSAALAHTGLDALTVIIVPFAVDAGVAEGSAGLLLTLGAFAGIALRLGSGMAVDRRQHTGLPWMAVLMAAGSIGFGLLALTGTAVLALAVTITFAGAWGWAGLLTFAVVRANPDAPAAAAGIVNTGKYVGAAAGPAIAGVLAEHVSFTAAWWVGCTVLAVGAIIVTALRATGAGQDIARPPERAT